MHNANSYVNNMEAFLKKFCFILVLIFALLIPFAMPSQVVFADASAPVEIYTLSDITVNGNYILARDIDYAGLQFEPISLFCGTLDGNGHKIKNLTIKGSQGDLAIFARTQNAKICNLQLENIKVELTNDEDTYASKVGFLVAEANGTTIQNVSVTERTEIEADPDSGEDVLVKYPSEIKVNTTSSVYVGGIAGVANSGTRLINCHSIAKMFVNASNELKQLYYGGTCGLFENSQAINIVSNLDLVLKPTPNQSYVGGMFGYCSGDKVEIKNCILAGSLLDNEDELYATNLAIATFIGEISCPTGTPNNLSINYFYTSLEGEFIGNASDIEYYNNNNFIDFDLSLLTMQVISMQNLCLKNFYLDTTKFDQNKEFNFDLYWQITEKKTLPFLQHFSEFEFTVSEDDSFSSFTKPNISSSVIEFLPAGNTFRYMGQVIVGGYVTSVKNIDKFYKVIGLKKDGTTLYSNDRVLTIIGDEETEVIEDGNTTIYKLHNDTVVAVRSQLYNNIVGTLYYYNDSNILWGNCEDNGHDVNVYYINDCNMQMEGVYSFVLDTISYKVEIHTEDPLHGTIRRDGAPENVKSPKVEDVIYYGQTLRYLADSTSDFAFHGWKSSLTTEDVKESSRRLIISFNENVFDEGSILHGYSLNGEPFVFYATYTKQVCEITIKFAVNDEIIDTNLSKIFINDREITPDANGVISQKVKKGSECVITVTLPEKHEFTNWFLSDGTKNMGALSEQLTLTLQIAEDEEQKIIVANLFQEKNSMANMAYLWWIIGGAVAGVAIVGLFVFLIVRKRKDNSYKNMYY